MDTPLPGPAKPGRAGPVIRLALLSLVGLTACALPAVWWAFLRMPPYHFTPPPLPKPNAFDAYCRAGKMLQAIPAAERDRAYEVKTPTAAVAPTVARCQPALKVLRQGFAHAYGNPPLKDPVNDDMPYLKDFRALARMLAAESRVKAARGDLAGALDSLLDALRLGREVPHGGTILHALVGMAVEGIAEQEMIVVSSRLDAAQCRQTLERLQEMEAARVPLVDSLRMERDLTRTWLMPVATGGTKAGGNGHPVGAAFASVLMRPSFVAIDRSFASAIEQAPLPARRRRMPRPSRLPLADLGEMPWRVLTNSDRVTCRCRLLEAELALRAYRLEHGRPAAALADLVPAYLPSVPVDPFGDGGPLRYRTGADPRAYSVGPDGRDGAASKVVAWREVSGEPPIPAGDLVVVLGQRPPARK